MADFADRSLGIGYAGGSALLLGGLLVTLALWYWSYDNGKRAIPLDVPATQWNQAKILQ